MTLADYILSKSTLPSGTIFDHILAMQTGGGQGTVFASMFSVIVEDRGVTVATIPGLRTVTEIGGAETTSGDKRVFCLTNQRAINVVRSDDAVTITEFSDERKITSNLPNVRRVTTKPKNFS